LSERKSVRNGYVESFNGRRYDELVNENPFFGLDHARSAIAEWERLQYRRAAFLARLADSGDICPLTQPPPTLC
jgi:transposase InsO family protein